MAEEKQYKLTQNSYGKKQVRLVRVRKNSKFHEITEVIIRIALTGNLDESYTKSDNSLVVPTDTVKNTVFLLAKKHSVKQIEEFGLFIVNHFIKKYSHIDTVTVELEQEPWQRLKYKGKQSHTHAFLKTKTYTRTAAVYGTRNGKRVIKGGLKDLIVMKTGKSGFSDFHKCDFTSLPEFKDRNICTSVTAVWTYNRKALDFGAVFDVCKQAILDEFSGPAMEGKFAASVQATLYEMGGTIIDTVKEIDQVYINLPNIHHFNFDLAKFGHGENNNEVLYKVDNPSGEIDGTVTRIKSSY